MVMPAGTLALSPEFEKAKADLQAARDTYSALVEEYSCLVSIVGKNLEAEYMFKLGKKEHELFFSQVEILRLKREIAIFQAARNRGERIAAQEVQKIIEKEFREYLRQLEKQQNKLKQAESHFMAKKCTEEETAKLKKLYRDHCPQTPPRFESRSACRGTFSLGTGADSLPEQRLGGTFPAVVHG